MSLFEERFYATQEEKQEEPPRMYRKAGPSSSRRNAKWLQVSGKLKGHQLRALNQVTVRPGLTSAQYAGEDYRWLQNLRRALPSLREKGLVRSEGNNTDDLKWYPTFNQRKEPNEKTKKQGL